MSYTIFHFYLQWTDDSAQPIFDLIQSFLISWKYENIVYTIWLWPYLLLYLQQHACLKVYSRWDQVFERWNRSHQTFATGDKLRRMTRLEIKNDVLKIALSKLDNSLFWRIDWWIFPIKTKFYNVKYLI